MDLINSSSKLIPLEREYEGWIISNIENYFETLGISYEIRALSPNEENNYPADELLQFPESFKVFGLQMKRPSLNAKNKSLKQWTDLKWKLSNPPHQYQKILDNNCIYYCLPAFTNRAFRKQSLSHCYFWRPHKTTPKSHTFYLKGKNDISDSMKWRTFINEVFKCKIGVKFDNQKILSRYLKINSVLNRESRVGDNQSEIEEENTTLYLVGVELP